MKKDGIILRREKRGGDRKGIRFEAGRPDPPRGWKTRKERRRKMKKTWRMVYVTVGVFLWFSAFPAAGAWAADPVRIGAIYPLTGPAASTEIGRAHV